MVRGGSGRIVAATIALLEKHQGNKKTQENKKKDNVESSLEDSPPKFTSSTDSGKDDLSMISTSSSSFYSNEDLGSICVRNDFQWIKNNERPFEPENKRGRERKQAEIRLRKTSVSLDRKKTSRRERDNKARSAIKCHPCYPHDFRNYCDCESVPPPHPHDFRIPYYYRMPCECYRLPKPTNELQEQLRRYESDKESLSLQVAVLTDQVDAQAEKISDLERTVADQKRQISTSEDLLQREMLTRSSLETQKLELLAVVSELKRNETLLEKEIFELKERLLGEKKKTKPPLAPRNHLYPTTSTPINFADVGRKISPSPSPVSLSTRKLDYEGNHTLQKVANTHINAETETKGNSGGSQEIYHNVSQSPSMQINGAKGIRKIFGKMKRSGSGNLDDIPTDDNFTRGGVRSTAGARLCNTAMIKNDKPFAEWTTEDICCWFKEMGLENYLSDVRRWISTGQTLLSAMPQEIDKELNIKNGLLRKKLHLALEAERGNSSDQFIENAGRLEPGWVLRWLDDIGLPQYKGSFMSAKIDGRLLHRLTLDDLQVLHINLALHTASIRYGIQVLRKEKFNPHCLMRRSDPENEQDERVELWTNARVMEWLRVVDLAEYAPNLRGTGVHGSLMVNDDRFNDTLLASLLLIPSEKTLLRRHLSTHFKELLGSETIQKKRETEATLGYISLTPTAKIPKKSQFTLKRKKSKYDIDDGELVCPLNEGSRSQSQSTTGESSPDGKSPSHSAASPDKTSLISQSPGKIKKKEKKKTSHI